ncbi:C40 family peptidase [Streptacidiphilus neutrinimicus]|uniref:C40 family peptidase n=1 Tax=Streptacidiphilus neutrinimicus TaxID=105420 RepID=UPI0005A87526|nr:C40 family peptidase [Streptacidiphilus neutrinimicus]
MNRPSSALASAALLLAAVLATPRAAADDGPGGPSAGRLASAQTAAQAAQAQVEAVETQLIAAQSAEAATNVRVESAVEAYNGAVVAQQKAAAQAAATSVAARGADAAERGAREMVGALAAQQYREGGPPQLAGLAGLLAARDPHAAELATEAAQGVAQQAQSALRQAVATATQAARADTAAQQANTAAAAATAKVAAARTAAQLQLAAQQAQVAVLDAQHTALLEGLADAQRVALQLTEAHAQALAAQAAKLAALAAPAKQQATPPPPPSGPGDVHSVLAFARAALGLPYVWGGAGPQNYDCSGLTMRAWERAGVELPHYAADQYQQSHPVTYRQLQPGDLVFWSHDGSPQGIFHVALFTGDDTVIEAPRTGDVVKTASLWIMGTPAFYARP